MCRIDSILYCLYAFFVSRIGKVRESDADSTQCVIAYLLSEIVATGRTNTNIQIHRWWQIAQWRLLQIHDGAGRSMSTASHCRVFPV
jgi:hypothetical protein